MSDIVHRLRNWVIAVHAPPVSDLLEEAATEIERLRQVSSQQNLTLTDEEREAVELAAGDYLYHQDPGGRAQHIRQTLLALLERTVRN